MTFFKTTAVSLTLLGAATQAPAATVLEEVVVEASRTSSEILDPARQVTVLDGAAIRAQMAGAGNAAELLSKVVPGMATASQTLTNFAQTLRGRKMLVLVDGIPLNTNRNTSRDLYNIDAEQIDRIEVLRGGNAIYGSGATGGVIAITTRRGDAGFAAQTSVSAGTSLTELGGDSGGLKLAQHLSASTGAVDYALTATQERIGAFYDAGGDRIAPEPSQGDMFDADATSFGAKLGLNRNRQRLQLMANYYSAEQDTDYGSDASVNAAAPGSVRARAVKGLALDQQNTVDNLLLSADYYHDDLLTSRLHAQLYYRDYETRFYPFDSRPFSSRGNQITQSYLDSETSGARLTVTTPLRLPGAGHTELLWGADLMREETEMPVTIYAGEPFDASAGLNFVELGDSTYMPPITHDSAAVFAQLRHRFNDTVSLDTGARHANVEASFDDFLSLSQFGSIDPQTTRGGSIDYDAWLYNLGLTFALGQHHELYTSYNQGFELPDIGLQVRNATADFDLAGSELEPIKTDNYELGWRGDWDTLQATLALFRSTSELGNVTTENFGLTLSRNQERIEGVEATLDYRLGDTWQLGGTLTQLNGEERPASAAGFRDMNGFRIPPLKLTAYLDYQPGPNQSYRLQALHSGGEDYRLDGNTGFGRREVSGYTTFDAIGQWTLQSSELTVSVENLLNKDYFPVYAQLLRNNNNTSHIPARGRWLRVSYSYKW